MSARRFTEAEKEAWRDGWQAAGRCQETGQGARHIRPNYLTQAERDAFDKGWDDREERLAMGYRDDDTVPAD